MHFKDDDDFADIFDEAEEAEDRLSETEALQLGLDTGADLDADSFGWRFDA